MTADEIAQAEALVNKEIQAGLESIQMLWMWKKLRNQEQWLCSVRNMTRRYVWYPWATSPKNSAVVLMWRIQASSIMLFKIVSESGIAAGVRRIEALTGNGVIEYYKKAGRTSS